MSNTFEYKETIVAHPGYYIQEYIDSYGISQEDFAMKLDTTPKNLSILLQGKQSLSYEMASKLASMLNTSIDLWINLQMRYDKLKQQCKDDLLLDQEKKVMEYIDYQYFIDNYNLPIESSVEKQISNLKTFLKIASLNVLLKDNLCITLREQPSQLDKKSLVLNNILIQIAINQTMNTEIKKFNKRKFEQAINQALTFIHHSENVIHQLIDLFLVSGTYLIILPNLEGASIAGAAKKMNGKLFLLLTDDTLYSDQFWIALLQESGHILDGKYGLSFKNNIKNNQTSNIISKLISKDDYEQFKRGSISPHSLISFSKIKNYSPSIILGLLELENLISQHDQQYNLFRTKMS